MEFNATFIVSAISFIIFTLIMNKILYQPISDIIQKRQAYFDANSSAAENNLNSVNAIKNDIEQQIHSARLEAKKMVADEVESSKQEKAKLEAEKKAETVEKFARKKADLEQERQKASEEMNMGIDDLSNMIISKLTGGDL